MREGSGGRRDARWRDVAARTLTATVGAYLAGWAVALAAARLLPLKPSEAALVGALSSVVPMVGVAIAAFAVRSIVALGVGLAVVIAVLVLAATGGRP